MEFLEGVPLTDLAAVQQVTDARPDEVLINALNTWFLSLTMCPTFHADVHAGALPQLDVLLQSPEPHSDLIPSSGSIRKNMLWCSGNSLFFSQSWSGNFFRQDCSWRSPCCLGEEHRKFPIDLIAENCLQDFQHLHHPLQLGVWNA